MHSLSIQTMTSAKTIVGSKALRYLSWHNLSAITTIPSALLTKRRRGAKFFRRGHRIQGTRSISSTARPSTCRSFPVRGQWQASSHRRLWRSIPERQQTRPKIGKRTQKAIRPAMWSGCVLPRPHSLLCIYKSSNQAGNLPGGM